MTLARHFFLIQPVAIGMLVCAFLSASIASADPHANHGWQPLAHPAWTGHNVSALGYDLGRGLVMMRLEPEIVEGRWLRASASTNANSRDFKVWIHAFDVDNRPRTRQLTTKCQHFSEKKVCSNATWIPAQSQYVRVSFYGDGASTIVEPGVVEIAAKTEATPQNKQRFNEIAAQIAKQYYRRNEVNWDDVIGKSSVALSAPTDIDPLPTAIAALVGFLPGNKHTFIYPSSVLSRDEKKAAQNSPKPSCKSLPNGVWRLDLPATLSDTKTKFGRGYVAKAHRCLRKLQPKQWLINLTENSGGNAFTMFAALAPIFGEGAQMMFTDPEGGEFAVVIDKYDVRLNQEKMASWRNKVSSVRIPITFAIGGACGSSCEAIAIAAKNRFQLVGLPTSGLTTANESLAINDQYELAITTGFMVDLNKQHFERVEPDTLLNDDNLKNLLKRGF